MSDAKFHVRLRPQAYCETCGKPATHEVRNHQNASYGLFCERHANVKKKALELSIAVAQQEKQE